jgi:capsular polysaccharide biosynthesis protein
MLRTISDVSKPLFRSAVKQKWVVAPAMGGAPSKRLMPSTEAYTPPWIVHLHNAQPTNPPMHEVACYQLRDVVVSGEGQIWLGRNLVAAPQIMPLYVNHILEIEAGGVEGLMHQRDQPLRSVSEPCLVAAGHGPQVYGHFLIEVLFRILTAKLAMASGLPRHKVLIDKDAPDWFVDILRDNLDIDHADLEFFEPASECVHLENALVPTRVLQEPGFHPLAKDLMNELVRKLAGVVGAGPDTPRRVFINRHRYTNHSAPHRICINEAELSAIAEARFGFTPVTIETLDWPDQIRLFRDARIVVGQAGSGLHNALFSSPGSRLGSIGFMNFVQTQIATLRDQEIAYLAKEVDLVGEFTVDARAFEDFMASLCEPVPA